MHYTYYIPLFFKFLSIVTYHGRKTKEKYISSVFHSVSFLYRFTSFPTVFIFLLQSIHTSDTHLHNYKLGKFEYGKSNSMAYDSVSRLRLQWRSLPISFKFLTSILRRILGNCLPQGNNGPSKRRISPRRILFWIDNWLFWL